MKREDIQYLNSWSKSFRKCSPAMVMKAVIEGIWISSNKDPEDIYLVYPRLIVRSRGGSAEVDKQFGLCPFEFAIEDGETYRWEKEDKDKPYHQQRHKGRDINSFGVSWCLDRYEMRKAITKRGLEDAKAYNITKDEIVALHKKHGWDDDAMYQELIENRPDLWDTLPSGKNRWCNLHELAFKDIRAAFCPHFDTGYNWMDYPEKAGFPEIPNREHRDYDWKAEDE